MSRPYRLAGLLRLRKLQEDQAASDLAVANAARRAALDRQSAAEGALADHGFDPVTDVGAWRSAIASRVALRGLVLEASVAAEVAATEVNQRELAWADARRRAIPLEKLEERHEETEKIEDLRQEQIVLDEIASRGTPRDSLGGKS
ncbi:flagellar FliJ protein [Sanguibacter gelidistatuariae]|uniref:Flagellar FliJ protein n=1 Tax=Sanguibacter gelidistatuariae TaxID=1814289 RepID=A0A1G6PXG3_9MICO|nr:flagellar FliJ family protein [Sanguibacter gelidistatuariae]SDC84661.1 flagellar FliJ protein [Sanguibacter gelidistatuariae]